MVAQGAEAGPQVEDQGRLAVHLDQDAGRVAPVAAVLVGRARARAPDAEEGDSHRRCRLVGRPPSPPDYPPPAMDHGDRSRPTASSSPTCTTGRPTGPWPSACTGSPTPPTPGGTCSPGWPRPATTPWRPSCGGTPPPRCPTDGRYDTGTLALDACELHEALGGPGDAVIIGHDWGAFATYGAAALQPDRWRRVVTAAVAPQALDGRRVLPLRPAAAQLVRVLLPDPAGRVRGRAWTTTPSSTGCGPTGRPASTGRGTRPG